MPRSFTAGRDLMLDGTLYALGDDVPPEVVAQLHNANALISRKWLVPWVDPSLRKGQATDEGEPTTRTTTTERFTQQVRRELLDSAHSHSNNPNPVI